MLRFLFGAPEKPVNQNKPQIRNVKKISNEGDLNMGPNSGATCDPAGMTKESHNPFTQADWGVNEPIIEGSDEINSKGKINMGPNSGITIGKRENVK